MGIYNIPDEQYRDMQGLSQSMAKRLLVSGLNFLAPRPQQSEAFRVGSLIDQMVLTPETVHENFVIPPDYANCTGNVTATGARSTSKNTAYVKEKLADFGREHVGKQFISKDEWTYCAAIAEAVKAKPFFKQFMDDATARTQVAFDAELNGVLCKGLADGLTSSMLFDLKTTRDATIKSFRSSFFKFGYGFQLRYYWQILQENGVDIPLDQCYIIAAPKQASPVDVTVFRVPVEWLEKAKDDIDVCLERYKRYRESGWQVGQDEGSDWMWLNQDQLEVQFNV
jgi:hypothetical protein